MRPDETAVNTDARHRREDHRSQEEGRRRGSAACIKQRRRRQGASRKGDDGGLHHGCTAVTPLSVAGGGMEAARHLGWCRAGRRLAEQNGPGAEHGRAESGRHGSSAHGVTQLQEELKKAKDQLSTSESSKKQAQLEADEAKKQFTVAEAKFEESQCQLLEFSTAEDIRLQELRKISQERDKVWQSELEALQKQHLVDSSALGSAMNEIQRLKQQLDTVKESETVHLMNFQKAQTELDALKDDMETNLFTGERLRFQISEKEKAEEEAKLVVSVTRKQFEIANSTIEALRSDARNLQSSFDTATSMLEESRVRISALEEMLMEHQAFREEDVEVEKRKPPQNVESTSFEHELEQLKAALEAAETKLQEEQIQTTMQIQSVYEMAEHVMVDAGIRELELESTLHKTKEELLELRTRFLSMEMEFLPSILQSNEELKGEIEKANASQYGFEMKLMKATTNVTELKANLLDKETELQSIMEENEELKSEINKRLGEHQRSYAAALADTERARGGEKEALMLLDAINGEVAKSSNMAAKVLEQLEATQTEKSEMVVELSRLRVQSDQWRKAAEAAAAILTPGIVERTGSMDSEYKLLSGKLMSSPLSDGVYDESPKKNNGNVLRKFGLWKKGQK
ncbi:hypothetical protein KSP39_PZI007253 [Platanthera zijinensis]|uniref:Uncharacterized protein n=1 Tax=Platanthera zijinensis TaxID=2320716 RepID=A0AAP0BPM3_9ASPA